MRCRRRCRLWSTGATCCLASARAFCFCFSPASTMPGTRLPIRSLPYAILVVLRTIPSRPTRHERDRSARSKRIVVKLFHRAQRDRQGGARADEKLQGHLVGGLVPHHLGRKAAGLAEGLAVEIEI